MPLDFLNKLINPPTANWAGAGQALAEGLTPGSSAGSTFGALLGGAGQYRQNESAGQLQQLQNIRDQQLHDAKIQQMGAEAYKMHADAYKAFESPKIDREKLQMQADRANNLLAHYEKQLNLSREKFDQDQVNEAFDAALAMTDAQIEAAALTGDFGDQSYEELLHSNINHQWHVRNLPDAPAQIITKDFLEKVRNQGMSPEQIHSVVVNNDMYMSDIAEDHLDMLLGLK